MKLTKVTQLDEFNGWDVGEVSDNALIFEFKLAWRDFFKKHSCPLTLAPSTLYPARDFCKRIDMPFRFLVEWSIPILGQFPLPWQLNLHWLQEDVEDIWLEVKDVYVPELVDSFIEAQKIVKANRERT